MAELRVSAVDAYAEGARGTPTALVSAVDAYAEGARGTPTALVSAVDALLEFRAPSELRVSGAYALLEFRAPPAAAISGVYAYAEFVPIAEPTVNRPPLAAPELRRTYLSIVYQKVPGEADWTMVQQGRAFLPQYEAELRAYRRIGDHRLYHVMISRPAPNAGLELYVDHDLEEIGRALGTPLPEGGWDGDAVVDLDPQFAADYKVENYDGIALGARLAFVEYLNRFWPARLTVALEADRGERIAEIEGFAEAYYIIPEASP